MIKSENGIIGLAIGDAIGVPIEFVNREELLKQPVIDMIGFGSHNVPKGCFSDDTSLTLATMDSIIECKEIDTYNIANRFIKWYRKGEYTATGKVFDIGTTTLQALAKYELNLNEPSKCGANDKHSNGNGSLMRMLPVAYYCYANKLNENEIVDIIREVSGITHRHGISILGCYIYIRFAIELLKGKQLKKAYETIKKLDYGDFPLEIKLKYERILYDNIKEYEMKYIKSTGYIVDTLEATFWVLLNSTSYNEAIIKAINLGDDTDTIGACVGGLAGIFYGIESIKEEWKRDLIKIDYILDICNSFDKVLFKGKKLNEEYKKN